MGEGKDHALSDALSCAPVDSPSSADLEGETVHCLHIRGCIVAKICAAPFSSSCPYNDHVLAGVSTAAAYDATNQLLISYASMRFPAIKPNVPQVFWTTENSVTTS